MTGRLESRKELFPNLKKTDCGSVIFGNNVTGVGTGVGLASHCAKGGRRGARCNGYLDRLG